MKNISFENKILLRPGKAIDLAVIFFFNFKKTQSE
jgi:hypothetical protein